MENSEAIDKLAAAEQSSALSRVPILGRREADAGNALVLAPAFQLFEYRIDAVLGQGGFGIPYLATDVHLNSKTASMTAPSSR